jgi:hypothetical protein
MQPTFNPWIGYFDLIGYVDKFIFLDNVQLKKRSWQVRNKIKVNFKEYMFNLPIIKEKIRDEEIISKVKLSNHLETQIKLYSILKQNYKKSKYYNEVNEFIKSIVLYNTQYLSKYNINIIKQIVNKLDFDTEIICLSETKYEMVSSKGDLIFDICKNFETTEYISPLGSKDYLDNKIEKFNKNNICVYYQYFNHPIYNQIGKEFIPYLGIIDLLYNEGFENSAKIIKNGRKYQEKII